MPRLGSLPHDPGDDAAPARPSSTARAQVVRVTDGTAAARADVLATEEPLEIRLLPGPGAPFTRIAVTMRTPGHDFELAAGFLRTEGILDAPEQIDRISYCTDPDLDGAQRFNIVNVALRPGVAFDPERLRRNFYMTSSCGVCGKASIDAIRVRGICALPAGDSEDLVLDAEVLGRLGDALRGAQAIFEKTGGLHAAGLFDPEGRLLMVREDVGRHNAVDKLVGRAFLDRRLPLRRTVLMVSGRASFEIMQKAAAAGLPIVAAVSAPSSLARDLAREFGMTLVGFARGARFSVYAGAHRIRVGGVPLTAAE